MKITLNEIRAEAAHVFGRRFKDVYDQAGPYKHGEVCIKLTESACVVFVGRSRMAARREAINALRLMAGKYAL